MIRQWLTRLGGSVSACEVYGVYGDSDTDSYLVTNKLNIGESVDNYILSLRIEFPKSLLGSCHISLAEPTGGAIIWTIVNDTLFVVSAKYNKFNINLQFDLGDTSELYGDIIDLALFPNNILIFNNTVIQPTIINNPVGLSWVDWSNVKMHIGRFVHDNVSEPGWNNLIIHEMELIGYNSSSEQIKIFDYNFDSPTFKADLSGNNNHLKRVGDDVLILGNGQCDFATGTLGYDLSKAVYDEIKYEPAVSVYHILFGNSGNVLLYSGTVMNSGNSYYNELNNYNLGTLGGKIQSNYWDGFYPRFSSDGTKLFTVSNVTFPSVYGAIRSLSLTTPYDPNSRTGTQTDSIYTETIDGFFLSSDGYRMVTINESVVNSYILDSPDDISNTATLFSTFNLTGYYSWIEFSKDGKYMFLINVEEAQIEKYNLIEPYKVEDAILSQTLDTSTLGGTSLQFNDDGTKMYLGAVKDGESEFGGIYQYSIS